MAEALSRDDVARVAELAMLRLTDDELDTFTPQMAAILKHADGRPKNQMVSIPSLDSVRLTPVDSTPFTVTDR